MTLRPALLWVHSKYKIPDARFCPLIASYLFTMLLLFYHNVSHGNNLYLGKYYKDLEVSGLGNKEFTSDMAEGSFNGNGVLARLQRAEE